MKPLTIQEVTEANFSDFLSLIIKLAEYEKLQPPGAAVQQRLRQDCLSDKVKYQAYIGQVDNTPVSYFTYSSFLALPTLYLEAATEPKRRQQNRRTC